MHSIIFRLTIQRFLKFRNKIKSGNFTKPKFIEESMVCYEAEKEEKLECAICFKKFVGPKKNNLLRHMRLHKEDQIRYKCLLCERTYQTKSNFQQHKKSQHIGIDPSSISFVEVHDPAVKGSAYFLFCLFGSFKMLILFQICQSIVTRTSKEASEKRQTRNK